MQVAKVIVNDEMLVVRVGEEQQAIHTLAGDDTADADVRIVHTDMPQAEFDAIPEYQ
ncbi:hypothetical protein [Burkholderia gladioli]|uniref:hypothetical protein n=1 Tax=Burkholderia gladioli TaxID=28095 RepID=UPI00163EB073|nr:hypothetical protein [Burkholderia gladioli]